MAGTPGVEMSGLLFTVKPLPKMRRFTHGLYPYWQGSKPRFRVTVERIEEAPSPEQHEGVFWNIVSPGRSFNPDPSRFSSLPEKIGDKCDEEVGSRGLDFTGDMSLRVSREVGGIGTGGETLYVFHSTSKCWLFLALVAGLVAGIFEALFQLTLFQLICT